MAIEKGFLRTRVARRVLGLLMLCSLLPMLLVGITTQLVLDSRLTHQAHTGLRELSKITAFGVIERLRVLDRDLAALADRLSETDRADLSSFELDGQLPFLGLTVASSEGVELHSGPRFDPPPLSSDAIEHLQSGRPLLLLATDRGGTDVVMGRAVGAESGERPLLWARLESGYLFGVYDRETTDDDGEGLCVLGTDADKLMCWDGVTPHVSDSFDPRSRLEWSEDGQRFIGAAWSLFLGYEFMIEPWIFIQRRTRSRALASVRSLKTMFALSLAGVALGVLLLGHVQVRRNLGPLEKLDMATRRIAAGDFDQVVRLDSRDEFEDLAQSFNSMAGHVKRRIATLSALREIDQALLASEGIAAVITTVLKQTFTVVECSHATIALHEGAEYEQYRLIVATARSSVVEEVDVTLSPAEIEELLRADGYVVVEPGSTQRSYLEAETFNPGIAARFLVVPILLNRQLAGFCALAFEPEQRIDEGVTSDATGLARQVALALANQRLILRLEGMGWATIRALARTVDAKSKWTAGHSERVTELALALGNSLELGDVQMDLLHRGGLVHDIGKIGVPLTVLDKAGPLDDAEWEKMKAHPRLGAKILAPIAFYADVLPIVLYHHEKYDGSGYPNGLVGEEIPFLARVLAVTDVYDALTRDRPYRRAMSEQQAAEIIREGVGSHFDPILAQTFLRDVLEGENQAQAPVAAVRIA